LSYIINKDLVYSTLGVPKAAMNIHGYEEVEINDLKNKSGYILTNTGRKLDVGSDEIAKWTLIHKNGKYNDTIHCPPTFKNCPVRGQELVTGHCKTKGADGAGKTEIRCIEVSFNEYDGISAVEWEKIARSNENRPLEDRDDFVKNDRTIPDIVSTLVQLKDNIKLYRINDNNEKEPTNQYLNKRLKNLLLPEHQWPKMRDAFYIELGVNKELIVGRTVTSDVSTTEIFRNEVKRLFPNKKILYKTLDAQGAGSIKYNIELSRIVIKAYLKGDPYDMVIIKHTRMKQVKMLQRARKKDRKFFIDPNLTFQEDIKMYKDLINGHAMIDIIWPEVKFEPQTDNEINEWNNIGKLV